MANIKSAKKRISVIEKKTAKNRRIKEHIKSVTKNFEKALAAGDMDTAQEKRDYSKRSSTRLLLRTLFIRIRLLEKYPE